MSPGAALLSGAMGSFYLLLSDFLYLSNFQEQIGVPFRTGKGN